VIGVGRGLNLDPDDVDLNPIADPDKQLPGQAGVGSDCLFRTIPVVRRQDAGAALHRRAERLAA
jgi:hypothetical protein